MINIKSKYYLKDFKNIAIIQTAFIGDIALTLYLANSIKLIHPNACISFVSTPAASELVSTCNAIDNVIVYDKRIVNSGWKGIKVIADLLKRNRIELVLTPHRSFRSSILTFLVNAKYSIGFNKNSMSFLYHKTVFYHDDFHEIERNFELLKPLLRKNKLAPSIKPILNFNKSDIDFIDNLLNFHNFSKFIILAPGSVWATKRWGYDKYEELSQKMLELGYNVILTGSKEDKDICGNISKGKSRILNLAGETSIPQTLILLEKAECLVTNDSAPIHFAGLVNCKTIAIFGPTSTRFGFYPRGKNDIVVENSSLNCRPCRIHGSNECPIKTHECMNSISSDLVLQKIKLLIP